MSVQSLLITSNVWQSISRFFADKLVGEILFEGELKKEHHSKEVVKEITERYKASVADVNKSIGFNIAFSVFALYAYFALPITDSLKLPIINLELSRPIWVTIAPLISYGLQILILTSIVWFLGLRMTLKIISKEATKIDVNQKETKSGNTSITMDRISEYPDVTNLTLKGVLGHLWILMRIKDFFKSKFNLIWYIPLILFAILVLISPLFTCLYFIIQLFLLGSNITGIIYLCILIPFIILFIVLIGMTSLLSISSKLTI